MDVNRRHVMGKRRFLVNLTEDSGPLLDRLLCQNHNRLRLTSFAKDNSVPVRTQRQRSHLPAPPRSPSPRSSLPTLAHGETRNAGTTRRVFQLMPKSTRLLQAGTPDRNDRRRVRLSGYSQSPRGAGQRDASSARVLFRRVLSLLPLQELLK
jgi:hypothetical protein